MKTIRKLTLILLLIGFVSASIASEKIFFGRWEPPVSLREFWKPISESWWNPDNNWRLYHYCQSYAKHSSPQKLLPDIILDLKKNPSVERTAVYSNLVSGWNQTTTLSLLEPYYKSKDADIHKIASDFIADIEELQEEAKQKE